jgi:hypothetical protein
MTRQQIQSAKPFDYVRKAAISLNNSAVTLIMNGFPREGAATLKDAVHLLRIISHAQLQTRSQLTIGEANLVQAALHRAQHYVSETTIYINKSGENHALVKPLWSQSIVYSIVVHKDFSSEVPMPVVIEPRADHESDETFDFECAFILYNYGISLIVKAKNSRVGLMQATMHQNALCIFELAETILAKHDALNIGEEKLLLGVLLMRSLIQIYSELSRSPPKEYIEMLDWMLTSIQLHYQLFPEASELRVAPAA